MEDLPYWLLDFHNVTMLLTSKEVYQLWFSKNLEVYKTGPTLIMTFP